MKEQAVAFFPIRAGKVRRYFDFKNVIDLFKMPIGLFQAYRILKREKPDIVFAKGGYVSVPVVLAARLLKIPIWIHESDRTPGLSTKITARFAKEIWLSFEESKSYFKKYKSANIHVVGNPIRKKLLTGSPEIGFKLTGLNPAKPVLLVIGGSTGAQFLNQFVQKNLKELLKVTQIVHITGAQKKAALVADTKGYFACEYLNEDLAHVYAMTTLALSRAGSGGIFELLALHKPMILVPLPKSASRGDQIENAEVFAKNGWAITVDQDRVSAKDLIATIHALAENPNLQTKQSSRQKTAPLNAAAQRIADALLHPQKSKKK